MNWETHGNGATYPDEFLSQQWTTWGKYWLFDGPFLIHQIEQSYNRLSTAVLEQAKHVVFDETNWILPSEDIEKIYWVWISGNDLNSDVCPPCRDIHVECVRMFYQFVAK